MLIIRKTLVLLSIAIALPQLAQASSGNPMEATDDDWRFTLAFPMIWAPSINGRVRGDERVDFTISFSDILEDLNFGIMGEFYANKGPFGAALRVNYMEVQDKASEGSVGNTTVKTNITMGVNDFLASWRVHDKVRLVTGIRHVHAKVKVEVANSIGSLQVLDKRFTVSDDNKFDLLVGINFDHFFNQRYGVMLNADLGVAGDNDRDYSVEFRALFRISELNNVWLGYRYLNVGQDTSEDGQDFETDLTQKGPTLGWAFTF